MRRAIPPTVTCLFVFLAIALAQPAAGQFGNLVNHVPDDANAMLLIDVDKLLDSPMAREEGWRAELEHSFSTGLVILPPQSSTKSEANPKLQCQRLETRSQDRVREDRQE